jgi:hypothetical protein
MEMVNTSKWVDLASVNFNMPYSETIKQTCFPQKGEVFEVTAAINMGMGRSFSF